MTNTAAPQRRTQAERTARTRKLLLDATLGALVELGYAGTTTTVVSERAGVSRGAQLHHFPNRDSLVTAAIEHLFEVLTDDYTERFEALGVSDREDSATLLPKALGLLWSSFDHPCFPAVIELYTAARTDRALHEALLPVAQKHEDNVRRLAHAFFPKAARAGRAFDDVLAVLTDTMHGMVFSRYLYGDEALTQRELGVLERTAVKLVSDLEGQADG